MAFAGEQRHVDVLRTAAKWFDDVASDGTDTNESVLTGEASDVLGRLTYPPPVFYILHPTAVALARSGHAGPAKAIVEAVPSMQSEARFRYWEEFRGMGDWEALGSELEGDNADAADITLETIVDYLREAVQTALLDEG